MHTEIIGDNSFLRINRAGWFVGRDAYNIESVL